MFGDTRSLKVVKGSVTARRDKTVAASGIQDHSADRLPSSVVSDRDAELRNPMQEIIRAVDRIDDPQMLCIRVGEVCFLGQDRMVRELAPNNFDNRVLRFDIGHRDTVEARLARFRLADNVREVLKVSQRDFGSGMGSRFGDSQFGRHQRSALFGSKHDLQSEGLLEQRAVLLERELFE